jgi:hypothetical protein
MELITFQNQPYPAMENTKLKCSGQHRGRSKMGVPIPNLDNRTYKQLMEEARKSIPNYASEWTNHNPADPGITIIELFAWLAEIISYRVNLVTEENCLKYLKLLVIRPRGTEPATADLTFKSEERRYLEKGTVFFAEKAGEAIDFELVEDIDIIPLQLEKIIVNEMSIDLPPNSSLEFSQLRKFSRGIFDRSVANTKEDLFFAPFGLDIRQNSELYLGFSLKVRNNERTKCENENGPVSLNFMCYIYEKDLIERGKHGEEAEYEFESAKLKWEISASPDGDKWKEVFPRDGTRNFMRSGSLFFTGLEGWTCSSISAWPSQDKEGKYFWLRCTLLEPKYEYPPRIEKINLNTVQIIQKKVIKDRMIGKSSGLPEQVFKLPECPVLRGSFKLILGGEKWDEVEYFDSSGPESTHFTLEIHKGEIRFGDGIRGKVPREGTEIQVLEYETSRGNQGNLPAGSRWTAKGVKLEGLTISNLRPATGGKREESIVESFERFTRDLKVPYRAVTSEDFEYIARETPGLRVAQAKAIPNFDPYSNTESYGSVTVVLIPFSPLDTFRAPPEPSWGFMTAVSGHLEAHRLLGTHIYVVSPEYVRVEVKVILTISKGFLDENIKTVVLGKLNHFLHPAKGGIEGKGWPVGKPVYLSEIFQLIMNTEGVDVVEKIALNAHTGAELDENGNLILASRISTVYSGEHSVEIFGKRR